VLSRGKWNTETNEEERMPDEEGNDAIEEAPETPLHAHSSGIEKENEHGAGDEAEGNVLSDEENSADDVEKTGGATSGGPPSPQQDDDPSQVEHNPDE